MCTPHTVYQVKRASIVDCREKRANSERVEAVIYLEVQCLHQLVVSPFRRAKAFGEVIG